MTVTTHSRATVSIGRPGLRVAGRRGGVGRGRGVLRDGGDGGDTAQQGQRGERADQAGTCGQGGTTAHGGSSSSQRGCAPVSPR